MELFVSFRSPRCLPEPSRWFLFLENMAISPENPEAATCQSQQMVRVYIVYDMMALVNVGTGETAKP